VRSSRCWSRSRLGAGIGAGAASGRRKSCPRALLPRGPQFRLLGAAPYISGFFLRPWFIAYARNDHRHLAFTNCSSWSLTYFQIAFCLAFFTSRA
jgi:hypothetical protein